MQASQVQASQVPRTAWPPQLLMVMVMVMVMVSSHVMVPAQLLGMQLEMAQLLEAELEMEE